MAYDFMLYGCTGYVGHAVARLAIEQGLRPLLASRNPTKVSILADELGLEARSFQLDDTEALG